MGLRGYNAIIHCVAQLITDFLEMDKGWIPYAPKRNPILIES